MSMNGGMVRNSHADWSSSDWTRHFQQRHETRPVLAWESGPRLSTEERRAVVQSIAIFQRGETGEGRHLLRVAQQHAEHTSDQAYVDALSLFIAEEGDHAALLGRYLDALGVPRLSHTWTDRCFRWLRHQAGLELTITVLVTAETIAMVYYAALRRATGCPLLRDLCAQILEDEVYHLQFQGDRLGRLYALRHPAVAACHRLAHRRLLDAVWCVVWLTHCPVFRRAEMGFPEARRRLLGQFQILLRAATTTERELRARRMHAPAPSRLAIS